MRFRYDASEELSSLFEEFRLMCNDAIRIALMERPKSRFRLVELAYPRLKEYGLHTHYILSACEVAYSAFKNSKRRSDPYVRKRFIKLDSQTYVLNHLILRIPTRPRHFIYLTPARVELSPLVRGRPQPEAGLDDPHRLRARSSLL